MQQAALFDLEPSRHPESSYLLASLEVFNWGPFHGKHRCEIDQEQGSAIIGPTGSGKTTLIDALMTLLAPNPRYNLASTGGHESDRDLISYIRGVSGAESAQGENDHVGRPGKTVTGLAATYSNGRKEVAIGALFWVDGTSNAADDLKRLWFFSRDQEYALDELLQLHHEGGKRSITRYVRETVGLQTFDSKKDYLAYVRSFFEVGENAFSLLNRAAGLKQLNSIDQIFRELVLDDHSAFERALEVAGEFDTLKGIYAELQTARRQRDSLLPVQVQNKALQQIGKKLAHQESLRTLLPMWFASKAAALWSAEVERLACEVGQRESDIRQKNEEQQRLLQRQATLQARYLQLGGSNLENLKQLITVRQKEVGRVQRNAQEYQQYTRRFGLGSALEEGVFRENQRLLPEKRAALEEEHGRLHRESLSLENRLAALRQAAGELEGQIREVKARPHSNIPPSFQAFREELAAALGLGSEELPFVAELVEVKIEENVWRGAIERAIGPERLRLLVPGGQFSRALAWVNGRDNRLHVRLLRADPPPPARFFDDGFTRKLTYRDHPLRGNVQHLLGQRDRHCVASTEELERVEHGLTREGSMSDRDGRFEKQDQRPLSEGWMTGFDNTHQLQSLAQELLDVKAREATLAADFQAQSGRENDSRAAVAILDRLADLEFSSIDLPGIQRELDELEVQYAALVKPESETAQAKAEYEAARLELLSLQNTIRELERLVGGAESSLKEAQEQADKAAFRRGQGLSDEETALAASSFPEPKTVKELDVAEEKASTKLEAQIGASREQRADTELRLVRAMEGAKREDTGALVDAGTEIRDLPAYLARLKTLEGEALPEKEERFLDYLNKSSGQGVTQLLSHISNEVDGIEKRVAQLNASLSKVDFRAGQYLQLEPIRVAHESLRQLEAAHRRLRLVTLKGESDKGESRYRALGEVIEIIRSAGENRRTLASQALLDPRHRLQFFVVEVDRASGATSGRRTGSQTGSGGEKEMMASYILTASLSYALCPAGASRPRYATIVLDEAFSKSSPAAAARIIEALRAFGLHPLFVTPNKEIALLKAHTRSAILVHNKNRRATLTSLTWQEIEAHKEAALRLPRP